jgi:hypothetical protein
MTTINNKRDLMDVLRGDAVRLVREAGGGVVYTSPRQGEWVTAETVNRLLEAKDRRIAALEEELARMRRFPAGANMRR